MLSGLLKEYGGRVPSLERILRDALARLSSTPRTAAASAKRARTRESSTSSSARRSTDPDVLLLVCREPVAVQQGVELASKTRERQARVQGRLRCHELQPGCASSDASL